MALPTFNQSGLFFVPRLWQRAAVIRWLKRIHAWTGFWGALLFLLMGTSGFLLNHRGTLKIDTGEPYEVGSMDIAVRADQFADADAMGKWAKQELGMKSDARPPRQEGPPKGDKREFMGKPHAEAEKWTRAFALPDGRVTVDYVPGSTSVSVRREGQGILSTIKNLHKGVGLGVFWVLFLDTIAGALVAMSLTGFLLWTRLHGSRLLAGVIVGTSLVLALGAIVPAL
ncbi:PepSY-associated TM helix domain-containing protein [soil metagenome]